MPFKLVKYTFFILLIVLTICSFLSCHHRRAKDLKTIETFNANYDQVWDVVLYVMTNKYNARVKLADKRAGVISSNWLIEERTFYDKETKEYYKVPSQYQFNITLRKLPEGVIVTINKLQKMDFGGQWISFPSDKVTETEFLQAIAKELEVLSGKSQL